MAARDSRRAAASASAPSRASCRAPSQPRTRAAARMTTSTIHRLRVIVGDLLHEEAPRVPVSRDHLRELEPAARPLLEEEEELVRSGPEVVTEGDEEGLAAREGGLVRREDRPPRAVGAPEVVDVREERPGRDG